MNAILERCRRDSSIGATCVYMPTPLNGDRFGLFFMVLSMVLAWFFMVLSIGSACFFHCFVYCFGMLFLVLSMGLLGCFVVVVMGWAWMSRVCL